MNPTTPEITYICMDKRLTVGTTIPVSGKMYKVIDTATRDEVSKWGKATIGAKFTMPPLEVSGHMFWYKAERLTERLN